MFHNLIKKMTEANLVSIFIIISKKHTFFNDHLLIKENQISIKNCIIG